MKEFNYFTWYVKMLRNPRSACGKLFSIAYNLKKQILWNNEFYSACEDNSDYVDIITIARNNGKVIEWQIALIHKNILDRYVYTVFDNSSNEEEAAKIRDICQRNKVAYARLKQSHCPSCMPSENHAVALNYVYHSFIKNRKSKYIALLDHDIFPIGPYSIMDKLNNRPYYGYLKKEDSGISYLWPGFSLFSRECFIDTHIDFMTNWAVCGDTGSSNYVSLYQGKTEQYAFAPFKHVALFDSGDPQGDVFSVMDQSWLHMLNASQWKKTRNYLDKEKRVYSILKKILNDELQIENIMELSGSPK